MIKYIPYLKFKQNEIRGVAKLISGVRDQIAPLYDAPRSQNVMTEAEIQKRVKLGVAEIAKSKAKNYEYWFFVDNIDIDESILIGGVGQYRFILDAVKDYRVIPVVALDRNPDHNVAALDFIKAKPGAVGVRLQDADIESYAITKPRLDALWVEIGAAKATSIALLIDLRIINDPAASQRKVERFLAKFNGDFAVSAVSISGSVIPGNIANLIATDAQKHVPRLEYRLWQALKKSPGYENVLFGDYGIISPEYSDIDLKPELMNGVSTPKVFYSYGDQFYISRGRRFSSHGHGQYFSISDDIVGQAFYRGAAYSYGDQYIHDRSYLSARKPPKGGSPSTWIESLTAAHITFIVNTI
ncbi:MULTISPECIES: beta family protein [Pseudomonas]|uniref:beta family protein n=1 Tax=Pseudomonas TaxID=286 RepID=UPI00299EB750|nr:hypothetical protein [Pseudomonas soli]MDW9405421.1 hypothetical protein [Pseudomonas soli]